MEGENVAVLPSHSWKIVESRAAELLDVTERHGVDAARAWLDDLGVEWWLPTRSPTPGGRVSYPERIDLMDQDVARERIDELVQRMSPLSDGRRRIRFTKKGRSADPTAALHALAVDDYEVAIMRNAETGRTWFEARFVWPHRPSA
ncbi:hypothetical protein Ae717Ps2_6416 [Pseudonocardia sp. Ae717_Ps2]|nr:hypothetical protein Ae717Ps2_6416 [Pseudonocardia sp. Ae717_Ps2]